jgi:hypothetical protein
MWLLDSTRSLQNVPMRVKFKLSIASIQIVCASTLSVTTQRAAGACANRYSELRFISAFKIMDSEISFMDLRIC